MDAITAHRIHFAFTATYHYLFPPLTMGLALLIVILKSAALRSGEAHYDRAARFWGRIFAINFAMGVVTGIPLEFQFGTNWSRFSRAAGGIIGQTLAMEGVFAFFLESSFLGLFLFGERRLGRRGHWLAAALVFLGSWLSGYFIVATAGLLGVRRGLAHRAGASSFLASAAYLAGMLASAAFGVHPFVLPAIGDARHALTVDNAAAPGAGLRIGLAWWVPGMLLAVAYCAYTCRRFRGKVTLEGEGY